MEHDGFKYDNNGCKNGITYYKCSKARSHFCKGSIKKLLDGTVVVVKLHTGHERDLNNRVLVNELREALKHRAATENSLLKNIYDEEARRHIVAAGLYPWSTAESIMRLARRNALPRLPNNLQGLAGLFENQQLTRFSCCNASFFKGCVHDVENKTNIIFACTHLIQSVLENDIREVHVDATFKVMPINMGYQLMTFHYMIQNYSIPIIYVLMENKTRNSYECVLRFIKDNLLPTLSPDIIMTDYETALRDVLVSTFPGARAAGCWFHHNQAVWRKMKKLSYMNHINNHSDASKSLRLLMCLPLLPAQNMETGFNLIQAFARNHQVHLERLFQYYQRYWLRSVGPQVVSVHGLPRRTNNNIESFHNSLKLKFSVNHPSLWIFLDHLRKLSVNYHIIVQQLRNNLHPTRHLRVAFLSNSRRIKNATEQFDLGLISIWQYLQQCSYTSAEFEQRQRNWALRNPNDEDDELPDEEPNGVIVMDHLPISPNVGINIPIDNVVPHINPPTNNEERSLCMVCMVMTVSNSNAQYIVLPCGHAWVCDTCIVQLEGPNSVCPLCRAMQISFQRIIFS